MAEGIKNVLISFVLVAIFVFAFISFGNQFQKEMDANQTILNESISELNKTFKNIEVNLSDAKDKANASKTSVEKEQLEISGGEITYRSIPKTTLSFWSSVISFFSILGGLIFTTLGVSPVIIGGITTITLIVLIFLFWKNIRTGN